MAKGNPVIGEWTCDEEDCCRIVEVRVNANGRCYYHCDGMVSEDGDGCKEERRFNPDRSRKMKAEAGYPPNFRPDRAPIKKD